MISVKASFRTSDIHPCTRLHTEESMTVFLVYIFSNTAKMNILAFMRLLNNGKNDNNGEKKIFTKAFFLTISRSP